MQEEHKLSGEELAKLRQQLKDESTSVVGNAGAIKKQEPGDVCGSKCITVTLAEDFMSAEISLSPPEGEEFYTVPEIIRTLRERKVVNGILTEDIMSMIVNHTYDENVLIAKGQPVTPGTEGYYEFLIDMEEKKTPEIREDGSVDYTAMSRLINVAEGDKIAIYHPAVQGIKGFNVCGTEINPKYAKEQPPLRGKYITKNDDNEYFATMSGKISLSNNNIEILNIYEINGDIDATKGSIDFYGDMIVNGNVEDGVTLRAGRNLTINGTVSGAKIFAGGDIVLSRGIQGHDIGKVSARGDVFAQFIEYANVSAGGNVRANYIMNSDVRAGGFVYAEGSNGSVIGGSVNGVKGVDIMDAGNISEPKTLLHAGFSEEDYREYNRLSGKEVKAKQKLSEIISKMTTLLTIGKEVGITAEQKTRIKLLNLQKGEIYAEIDKLASDKKFLNDKLVAGANASIVIRGTVYRNTLISIDMAIMAILKEEQYVRFVCRNEGIERKVIL